jgi:S1-C subfamily serine protease
MDDAGNAGRTLRAAAGIALAALAIGGCAPASTTLVSSGGDVRRCPSRGGDECIERARAGGYVERGEVGGIGVTVAGTPEQGRGLRILNVLPGSPAAAAGIEPGDFLVRVKGESVRNRREARMLMFGRAGTKVEVTVRKGKRLESIAIERASIDRMTSGER